MATIVGEPNLTITVLPKTGKSTVHYKCDVAADVNMQFSSKLAKSNKVTSEEKRFMAKSEKSENTRTAADLEMGFSQFTGQTLKKVIWTAKRERGAK